MNRLESRATGGRPTRILHEQSALDQLQHPSVAGAIVASLVDPIVVVDGDGSILQANAAWTEFAALQLNALHAFGIGASYFDFCRAMLANDRHEMPAVIDGVRAVANRNTSFFRAEYLARTRSEESWCLLTATPLAGDNSAAVIAHRIVTRDRIAAIARFGGNAAHAMTADQHDVASRLVSAQEDERSRIGRELHDDVGQQAALLAVKLETLSGNARISAVRLRAGVADAERMLHQLAISIHELSHQLHPAKLKLLGLVATVESLCREVSRESGARVTFSALEIPPNVPEQAALCAFRVTQEALQNAVKHSGAEDIAVQLRLAGSHLMLRVSDTGSGFDPGASNRTGIGLVTMNERVELSGGSLKISAARSTGTIIEARIPLARINSDMPS